jgi:hypothetical protein
MAKKSETTPEAAVPVAAVTPPQVDSFAAEMFTAMGFQSPLPDSLVTLYKAAKLRKDKLQPGRMTIDGLAVIAAMSDLVDGKICVKKE